MPLENEINPRNINGHLSNERLLNINAKENPINPSIRENNNDYDAKERNGRGATETRAMAVRGKSENRSEQFDIERTIIDKCGKLLCIESHSNGVVYEEYVFKLSTEREIKIKYPVLLNNEAVVRLEFVDNENDYEVAPMDRMLILFKNVYVNVNVKQTGVPCSTQTTKIKTSNIFTQTTVTGVNSFSRLNMGATVSEKNFHLSHFEIAHLKIWLFY